MPTNQLKVAFLFLNAGFHQSSTLISAQKYVATSVIIEAHCSLY